jgi:hypothetical protein
MKIKVLFDAKKGSSRALEEHFELVKKLMNKYPNALWRKYSNKGKSGYELYV